MPSWSEYKTIARERGALAMELYCVESTPAAAPEEMQKHLPDHLAYQKMREAEGKLVLAGPLSDESGTEMTGGGMIIYRASSLEEATQFAAEDPMHKAGARNFTIRCWLVNEGSLSFTISLSDQRVSIS